MKYLVYKQTVHNTATKIKKKTDRRQTYKQKSRQTDTHTKKYKQTDNGNHLSYKMTTYSEHQKCCVLKSL